MPTNNKATRVSARKRSRNQPLRSRAKTFVARTRKQIAEGDYTAAAASIRDAEAALDKAAQKGAIHAGNASRRKARITKQLYTASLNR